jgi:hypothetical protein
MSRQLSFLDLLTEIDPVSEKRPIAEPAPVVEASPETSADQIERALAWGQTSLPALVIESESKKGRAFSSTLLAHVTADGLWSGGEASTDNERPVWAMFCGSEQELRPFVANLRCGRKAVYAGTKSYSRRGESRLEVLKSGGYSLAWQRADEGAIATLYLPDLFRADPGMTDPAGASFVLLPPRAWADEQWIDPEARARAVRHAASLGHPVRAEMLSELVPVAALFAVYLDRRVRLPLVADLAFYLQLLLACLDAGLASWSAKGTERYRQEDVYDWGVQKRHLFEETRTSLVGLLPGVSFLADHESLGALLASEASRFFGKAGLLPWRDKNRSPPEGTFRARHTSSRASLVCSRWARRTTTSSSTPAPERARPCGSLPPR